MTVSLRNTAKDTGAASAAEVLAPVINPAGYGVPTSIAAVTYNTGGVFGGDSSAATTNYCGFRREIAAPVDLTDRQYIQFQLAHSNLSRQNVHDWTANGMMVVFEDTSGNWAAYRVFGGDSAWGPFGAAADGYFAGFTGINSQNTPFFHLERSRTPDFSSVTPIDWALVDAYEVHFRPAASGRMQAVLASLRTVDAALATGTVSTLFTQIRDAWAATLSGSVPGFPFKSISPFAQGFASLVWAPQIGFQVGDGATATTGTITNFGVGFWNPPEDTNDASPTYVGVGAFQLLGTSRLCDIFQSATDSLTWNDGVWASSSRWGLRVRGSTSGVCAFNRNTFFRAAQFECAHGEFTDCIWDGHTEAIQITAATGIVRGAVRNGVGHGIKITGAAGNYAALDVAFDDNTTYDIELGSGGAGTYVLTGVTTTDPAYTLKIRNDSATNAVVVELEAGITYSTSTAGGTISVTTPAVYQSVTVNGLVAGSRVQIYDTTSSTELYNAVVAGTSVTWTDSVAASASRAIRVRAAHVSGTTAYNFLEANIGTAGTGSSDSALTYLANQTLDTTYNSNAIDGSTVTDITISDGIDRVVIAKAGGSVTWPTIYAYQCYWNFTAAGIVDDGAIITASDTANYRVVGFKIRNTSTVPLVITGGYGVDSGTGLTETIIDSAGSTGNIYAAPEHVVAYATGSGLTAGEQAQLTAAANAGNLTISGGVVSADIKKVNGYTVAGEGTAAAPWGP